MPYTYDYPRPAVTCDIALVTIEPRPRVLLIQRKKDPFASRWAFPGGFVDEGETLLAAARRELLEETGLSAGVELEQLETFGDPGRDPRGWTVSIVWLGRVLPDSLNAVAADDAADAKWWPLDQPPGALAFDHDRILEAVVKSVR